MKGKTIVKKLTVYASITTLLFVLSSSSIKRNNKEMFNQQTKISRNKIECDNVVIYIGNDAYLKSINDLKDTDVLVLDDRMNVNDPNVRIYDSYKIKNPEIREKIVDGLLLYEDMYPTDWYRTKKSMIREWVVHNYMYQLGYKINSTIAVDFNNNDEMAYRIRKNTK